MWIASLARDEEPEDALALLNALEAKESLTKDDVRALAQCSTNDDERACQLLDDACSQEDVALEACATTLTLASERGGAYASAERTNERAQQLRRQACAGMDVEEGLTALSDLISQRALEDAAVAAACGAAGAVLQTRGTPTALLVWRAAARSYPSHRAALLEDWLDIARNETSQRIALDDDLGGQARWASVLALVVTEACVPLAEEVPSVTESERCASALCGALLRRCREGPNESDWRELALAFSSDLVAALEAPAWSSSSESVLRSLARSSSTELRKAPADRKNEPYVCFLGDLLAVIVGGVSSVTKRATSSVTPVVQETGGACDVPEENQRLEALVAFQQLQLNGLQQRSSSEPLCGEALRFSVAKWHAELPDSASLRRMRVQQSMKPSTVGSASSNSPRGQSSRAWSTLIR